MYPHLIHLGFLKNFHTNLLSKEHLIRRLMRRNLFKEKNKEWDTLNKNIDQMLNEIFQTGHQIRLPNPVYPNNRKRDLIFKNHAIYMEKNVLIVQS